MADPTIVHVPLGERAYDIVIGDNLLERAGERLKAMFPGRRFGIVTDSEVAVAQLPRLSRSLDAAGLKHAAVVVPNGEKTKSIAHLNDVVEGLLEARLERGDIVLALGGGVIGDLAGFAAAVTRRNGRCGSSPRSRSRAGLRRSPAGSSPKWDGSLGSSPGCCAQSMLRATLPARSWGRA